MREDEREFDAPGGLLQRAPFGRSDTAMMILVAFLIGRRQNRSRPSYLSPAPDHILPAGDTHSPENPANMVVLGAEQSDAQSLPFEATLAQLASVLPEKLRRPRVGIVCGSGLSTLAAAIRDVVEVPYASLPGFGKSTGTPPTLPCA